MSTQCPDASLCITLDTDWAPQYMLDYVLGMAHAQGVPVTVFCTSPYALPESPHIEAALHPNLMADSTHGNSEEERLDHVQGMFPSAVGHRAHRYYWHSGMYGQLARRGLLYDSSALLPFQAHLAPSRYLGITRFPIWCGDNLLMDLFPDADTFAPPGLKEPGLKVLTFHPVHIYLNSRSTAETQRLLQSRPLPHLAEEDATPLRRGGKGLDKIFADALRIAARQEQRFTLQELL